MKEKITEVALAQFLQHGIRSMTVKKLVEPMGISTKTVYKYFSSKEELLEECLRVLYSGYHNEFMAILSTDDSPVNKLLILFRATVSKDFGVSHAFFHDLNYYYPELQNTAINRISNSYGSLMIPLVQKGITEGYFHRFIMPEVALKGIGLLYASITRSEDYKDYEGSPYELFKNLVEVYIRGMCTEKGLKEIENNPYHNE
ncbi:TetR/AcrR family transcriptional regulator [Mucilaginibacter sp. McL0603]|uniref:TetR/AcrR family transcriptional regulator n=1 Tax=Mucilaginibacter sp. McL0603 TaxID=3415670 RepID=UPI003CEBB430